jgi:hypothetical protein
VGLADLRIDEQLHIVIPVIRADGTTVHVHAAPISREVFQRYWRPMARAYNYILQQQLVVVGPRIAGLALRDAARDHGELDGPTGVEAGLLTEIQRLANVVAPSPTGWQMIPYADALRDGAIDQEDADEIEGVLVFFTLAWRLHRIQDRRDWIAGVVVVWGARTLSLNLSEFANSLTTSTETGNIGATHPAPFSPPSLTGQPMLVSPSASASGPTISPGIAA